MRLLIITRGAPGSGKSTSLEKAGLKPYTLCPDDIRLLYQSPTLGLDGIMTIPQDNDRQVWAWMFERLEQKMARGELVCVDAMHATNRGFDRYKHLADQYRYRVLCLDFAETPIEIAKDRNRNRALYKQVPEAVIDSFYERATWSLPGWMQKLSTPSVDVIRAAIQFRPMDASEYENIWFFGDLHGCLDPLRKHFDAHPKGEKDLCVFVGDIIDRGPQNAEVLDFCLLHSIAKSDLVDTDSFIFLEGNHERWLWDWANDQFVKSPEFRNFTQPQLDAWGFRKKAIREFYQKLRQCLYLTYGDKHVIVSHAGVAGWPHNWMCVPTHEFIHMRGLYTTDIDGLFQASVVRDFGEDPENNVFYQVHGHRNGVLGRGQKIAPNLYPHSINLEADVEFGGYLVVAQLNQDGWTIHRYRNEHVCERKVAEIQDRVSDEPTTLLNKLRKHKKSINERPQEGTNIASFNFSKTVFYDKSWDEVNTVARGLFINTKTGKIVARSYPKFFNYEERPETTLHGLKQNLTFPVTVYQKENGFLGITGWDDETNRIVTASKSTIHGPFAENFTKILTNQLSKINYDELGKILKEGYSAVFEVIDPVNDPHIIEYRTPEVVLLDFIKRTETFEKMPYEEVVRWADLWGIRAKTEDNTFGTWEEFEAWLLEALNEWNPGLEGYVIEGANGFMTKVKLSFYVHWKRLRTLKDLVAQNRFDHAERFAASVPFEQNFLKWAKTQSHECLSQSIIAVRKFYEAETGARIT